jgi:hypothetical protein
MASVAVGSCNKVAHVGVLFHVASMDGRFVNNVHN